MSSSSSSSSKSCSKSSASSNNLCVICLEPLLKVDDDDNNKADHGMCNVGVASCGHPCHTSCFDSWAEFHKGKNNNTNNDENDDDKKGIPCPTCQQETTSFVKIFLRPEPNNTNKLLLSDSDDEEEKEDAEEEDKEMKDSATSNNKKKQPVKKQQQRRKKTEKAISTKKKMQYYKTRWLGKLEECKQLKLEAKNRKRCHHEDLVDLERSQLLNFRLMKQLESTIKGARYRRNAVALLCFGLGWYCSNKFS